MPIELGTTKDGICILLKEEVTMEPNLMDIKNNSIKSNNNSKQQLNTQQIQFNSTVDHYQVEAVVEEDTMDTEKNSSNSTSASSSQTLHSQPLQPLSEMNYNHNKNSRNQLQEERWKVELELLRKQATRLAKILSEERINCRRTHRSLNVVMTEFGEEFEFEDDEKRALRSDVRYLELKLKRSERENEKLSHELRALKVQFLNNTPSTTTTTIIDPSLSYSTSLKRNKMGEAEAEHLLLASKRLTNVQRNIRIPFTHSVHPLSSLYFPAQESQSQSQSNSQIYHHPVTSLKGKERENSSTSTTNFGSRNYNYNNHNSKELQEQVFNSLPEIPMTPGRTRVLIDITSPTYGMDNLLQAANILGPSPSQENSSTNGKKRRLSPPSLLGGMNGSGSTSTSAGFFSALNVLANEAEEAQASQSTSTSNNSNSNNSNSNNSNVYQSHYNYNPTLNTTNNNNGNIGYGFVPSSNPVVGTGSGVSGSGGGGGGIGSGGGPGSRPNNQTRNRAPYIKWNLAEDELLVKAIIIHGTRWDPVASAIPTRTYHQARQRWLRGLKRGTALPPELQHYTVALGLNVGKGATNIEDLGDDFDEGE